MPRHLTAIVAVVCLLAWPAMADQPPLKLGMLLDLSGPYSDLNGKGSQVAAEMAIEDFGGAVLGRRIELLAIDHQNKPDLAVAKAKEWFSSGVQALLEVVGSAAALAVQDVARQADKVLLMNAPAASRLVNEDCSPTSVLYTFSTYAIAHSIGEAVVADGGKRWFFIAADYAFGAGLVNDTGDVVRRAGGTVVGSAKHPLNASDFSAQLLEAQNSGADVIALANGGADTTNAVKQAAQFGIGRDGRQRLVALVAMITDINSLGLQDAQGLLLTEAFYWDESEAARAWSQRFFARMGKMPTMLQAGAYSSTLHYLQAVRQAGTVDTAPVMAAMRAMPIDDFFAQGGHIRADGQMMHDMYLFQVKTPAESKGPWDFYKRIGTVPADKAFPPLADSKCKLVRQ